MTLFKDQEYGINVYTESEYTIYLKRNGGVMHA
jgi:hypothetical protein